MQSRKGECIMSFEQSLKRLDEIVSSLQSGKLSLDESLKLFEEGTEIIASCNRILDEAEQKVVILKKSGEEEDFNV